MRIMTRPELQDIPEAWPGQPTWFWHGEQILALLEVYKPKVCVELGSWRGGSAIATARLVRQWGGMVTCVDVWEQGNSDLGITLAECRGNIERAGVADVVRFIQSNTHDAARLWDRGLIDYLYVDADHSYEGCKADLELWWPHVKVGGLVAGDDYDDPRWGVRQAWDEFEVVRGQQFQRHATPGTNPPCTQLIWGEKR